ncbi:MAG: hypothetical protein ACR2N4_06415 [Jatrophihabitans sp.]
MAQRLRPAIEPERLTTGPAGSVLVADFQPFAGHRLGESIASAGPGLAVQQLDPARDLAGSSSFLPLEEIAERYARRFADTDTAPAVTVIGCGSAAVLALRIAALLAGTRTVDTVLVRPVWPGPGLIGAILATVRSELGLGSAAAPALTGDPATVWERVTALLQAEVRGLAVAHGLDAEAGPLLELLERYRGWFGYLLAAQDALGEPWTSGLDLRVYLDTHRTAAVPWRRPATYDCRLLAPPVDKAAPSEHLARVLLGDLR